MPRKAPVTPNRPLALAVASRTNSVAKRFRCWSMVTPPPPSRSDSAFSAPRSFTGRSRFNFAGPVPSPPRPKNAFNNWKPNCSASPASETSYL